jgi:hypothetical protein
MSRRHARRKIWIEEYWWCLSADDNYDKAKKKTLVVSIRRRQWGEATPGEPPGRTKKNMDRRILVVSIRRR